MKIKFLQKKPFYIFVIENFLDDFEYQLFDKNFPKEVGKKIKPVIGNKRHLNHRDELFKSLNEKKKVSIEILEKKFNEKFCTDLIKKLKKELFISRLGNLRYLYSILRKPKIVNKQTKKNLLQKIFYSYFERVFEFSFMYKGSFISPHTDKKSKLLSLMLYFPSKNLENLDIGTTFYNSKIKNFNNKHLSPTTKENQSFFEKNFNETITFPFSKKNLYCFIKSDLSWHAVKELDIPEGEVRRSININIAT